MDTTRRQRRYDHRLVNLVRRTGDVGHATRRGVPRSTAAGRLARPGLEVLTPPHLDESAPELRVDVASHYDPEQLCPRYKQLSRQPVFIMGDLD